MKASEEEVLQKAINVINSCETPPQVRVASRFARLACDLFPDLYCQLREALTRVEMNVDLVRYDLRSDSA